MRTFDIPPKQFSVGDFLGWKRAATLELNPAFQRRSVWKPENRAYLLDTVLRGLPVPLIFIRERVDLGTQQMVREVVDGQQRLRSLIAYIDPASLEDFDPERDAFVIPWRMNNEVFDRRYADLEPPLQMRLLGYAFSVQVLGPEVEDRDVLEIFARLNSTGYKLNHQELRNAEFFGEFKSLAYDLALQQFENWRSWGVMSDDQLSRMQEVQLTSDLLLNMIEGLEGRSQSKLRHVYEEYDKELPGSEILRARFSTVMDTVDTLLGAVVRGTVYSSEVHFFSLFTLLYQVMWGLGSPLDQRPSKRVPTRFRKALLDLSAAFAKHEVPEDVLDAVQRASTDKGRRQKRLDYMLEYCGFASS